MDDAIIHDLKHWREKFGFSQKKFAEIANISLATLRQIEAGQQKPQQRSLKKIEVAFEKIADDPEFLEMLKMESKDLGEMTQTLRSGPYPKSSGFPDGPIRLSNIDLELINRILNMSSHDKLELLKRIM